MSKSGPVEAMAASSESAGLPWNTAKGRECSVELAQEEGRYVSVHIRLKVSKGFMFLVKCSSQHCTFLELLFT